MNRKTEKIILFFIALLLVLFKQFLIGNLPIEARFYPTDDRLMIDMAMGLRSGTWLGPYKGQLLMKGAFFPMLLAPLNKLGLNYLGVLNMLNALAALFFVSQLRGLLKRPVLRFILFTILLFDPCSFSRFSFQRVYRSSITEMQVLFLWGAYYGLYRISQEENAHFQLRELLLILLAGFDLWAMWNTREDGIWVMPFVLTASGLIFIRYQKNGKRTDSSKNAYALRCASLLIPFLMLFAGNRIITRLNEHYYGEPVRLEVSDGAFAEALKSIYSVKNRQVINRVTVTHEKLERLLSVSPALQQIRSELEAELARYDKRADRVNGDGEVEDGWFFWALKYAAFKNGAADTLPKSQAYWSRVHQEVEAALDDPSSDLERQNTMPSPLMSPLREDYLKELPKAFIETLNYMVFYRGMDILAGSSGRFNPANDRIFESVTNNIAVRSDADAAAAEKLPHLSEAVKCLTAVRDLYRLIDPAAAAAGLICFLILLFQLTVKKQQDLLPPFLIICGMAFSLLLNAGGITYTEVSAFNARVYHYLSGAYPLMLGSIWFTILYSIQQILNTEKGEE